MEDRVDVAHRAEAEAAPAVDASFLQQVGIQGVEGGGGEVPQGRSAQARDDVTLQVHAVAAPGGAPELNTLAFQPLAEIGGDRILRGLDVAVRLKAVEKLR